MMKHGNTYIIQYDFHKLRKNSREVLCWNPGGLSTGQSLRGFFDRQSCVYTYNTYIHVYTCVNHILTQLCNPTAYLNLPPTSFSDPVPKSCFFSAQKTFQDLLSNSGPGHFGVSMVMAIIGCKHVKPTFGGYSSHWH